MRWLIRLYPKEWQNRYGEEFLALLEEQQISPRVVFDILLGAIDAHLRPQISADRARIVAQTAAVIEGVAMARQLRPWSDPRKDAMVLGVLNVGLALMCAITFFGVLAIVVLSSEWLRTLTGNPSASVPFPVPVLFLLYAAAFIAMWAYFARGLPPRPRSQAIQTGLLGATPLFGLSLLGYLGVAWIVATGDFGSGSMLAATVWIYGILSTLILLAGLACMVIVAFFSPRLHP